MALLLIVDDDELLLDVLKTLLQSEGYDVITALDGHKAIGLVRSVDVDLVLSDIRMRPMNGIELLRLIRKDNPDLPVIMLTAFASPQTEKESQALNAFAYLSKPFTNEEVVDTIQQALESAPPPSASQEP